jgi:hypothetical protein
MAKRTVESLVDDIDGSEAQETIEFSFRGKSYTLDLNEKNASEFDDALAPYVAAAEKAGTAQSSRGTRSRGSSIPRPRSARQTEIDPRAVRSWAESQGITVSPRGRIKSDILEQYKAANA